MQPDLGLPGALVRWRAAGGQSGSVAVVPRRLDQQPPGVLVPREGDVPAVLLITGGVLRRDDPQPGRELARVREPVKVADLGDQAERGDRRDPTEARQDLHLPGPPLA